MGASVSNISRTIKTKVKNQIIQSGSTNVCDLNQGGVRIENCKNCNFGLIKITQKCTVSSETYYKNLISALTDLSSTLDTETQAALGLSVGNVSSAIKTKVDNIMNSKCNGSIFKSNIGAIEVLGTEDSNFDGFVFYQGGDATGKCSINGVIDEIAKVVDQAQVKVKGSSLLGLLAGDNWIYIVAAVIAVGGIGVAAKVMMSKKKNKHDNE